MAQATKDSQISLRLPNALKERMQTYADLTGRNKSHVVMEALSDYLDGRMPQVEDLKLAVQQADLGDFARDEDVAAVFARYAATASAGSVS